MIIRFLELEKIGSLQGHTGYLTFSLRKTLLYAYVCTTKNTCMLLTLTENFSPLHYR